MNTTLYLNTERMYALQQVHDLSSNEHKKQEQQTATVRDYDTANVRAMNLTTE